MAARTQSVALGDIPRTVNGEHRRARANGDNPGPAPVDSEISRLLMGSLAGRPREVASPDNAPELSIRAIFATLLYFERQYGAGRLQQIWARSHLGLSLDYLKTPTNFVSLRFLEKIAGLLVEESGDPRFMRKAGLFTATVEGIGFPYYMVKAFGSVRSCYQKIIELYPTYNRVGEFTIERLERDRMLLRYRSRVPESNRNICELRMGQFASAPAIWGLPYAKVSESHCQLRGDECCRYHVIWQNPMLAWRRYPGLAIGLAAGLGFWAIGGAPLQIIAPALTVLGGIAGSWLDLRHELRRKDEYIASQNEGMMDSMRDLQQRYEEVYKSKLELEQRVEERTHDLSEANGKLQDANVKLGEALAKQKEVDELKTRFFDNVSHELRTPLTLILLSLESMIKNNRPDVPAWVRQHLETIERSSNRLLRLINHLLDLAKMEAGKTRLRYESVDLREFIKSMLLPFHVFADQKRIQFSVEGGVVSAVLVDAEKMDSVFQNLVSNALKFTPEGGSVTVRISENDSQAVIEIADTGVGMGTQDLPVIFDRFAQADSSGLRRFGGTGIGLALVKETVELHGGAISVTSELGVGSCFRVTLPKGTSHVREELRERRADDVPVIRDRRALGAPLASLRPMLDQESTLDLLDGVDSLTDTARARILVVEDDPAMRRFLVNILRQRYQVIEASDGEDGLRRASAGGVDLVLSDVVMPRMSGLQLTRALKEKFETSEVPVVLLTARGEADNAADGLTCGANDYIGKPFSPRELLARIETQLRLRDAALAVAENERLAALGLLTSGFAHEVRNPLNGLLNSLSPLKKALEGVGSPGTGGLLEIIQECGNRIRHLSESLLSFARPSEGEGPVDVPASIDAALKLLGWRTPPGVVVERRYDFLESIRGHAAALNEVWLNLIDNALRAIGNEGRLTLSTERCGDDLRVIVADSGAGIPEGKIERIFEPFFSTRPAGEGSGLGLALCRRIILQHGGRISATSEPGRGTRILVTLPIAARSRTNASSNEVERRFTVS